MAWRSTKKIFSEKIIYLQFNLQLIPRKKKKNSFQESSKNSTLRLLKCFEGERELFSTKIVVVATVSTVLVTSQKHFSYFCCMLPSSDAYGLELFLQLLLIFSKSDYIRWTFLIIFFVCVCVF